MTFYSRLYQSLRNMLPWPQFPECRPPLQHPRTAQDDDIEFWEALRYLDDLAAAIQQETTLAKYELGPDYFADLIATPLIEYVEYPVESAAFWAEFGDWPADHAEMMLSQWRSENALRATVDAILDGIQEAV